MAKKLIDLEKEYAVYIEHVRACNERTVGDRVGHFRRFARYMEAKGINAPQQITLGMGYEYLEDILRGFGINFAKNMTSALKSVLGFFYYIGAHQRDLSEFIITPTRFHLSNLPKGYSNQELAIIIEALKTESPDEYLEVALVQIFMNYGLRTGEVAQLELDDIDWNKMTIAIRRRKNIEPLVIPLIPPVEKALRNYIDHSRPTGQVTRTLFLSNYGNHPPLRDYGVRLAMQKYLEQHGVKDSIPYKFRHTLAIRLINDNVPLCTIKTLLGHTSCESTLIYAKLHWQMLREVSDNDSLLL